MTYAATHGLFLTAAVASMPGDPVGHTMRRLRSQRSSPSTGEASRRSSRHTATRCRDGSAGSR